MTNEPEAVWYCVISRDQSTQKIVHYRCMTSRKDAEIYKIQMETSDQMCTAPCTVTVETFPAGVTPSLSSPQPKLKVN
jgi:hypothetical protein